MKRRWMIGLAICGVFLVGGAGYLGFQSQSAGKNPEQTATAPPTIEASQGDVVKSIIAPGILINYSEIDIVSLMSGMVEEVFVRAGNAVKEGDVLLRYSDKAQYEANLAGAEFALIQAQNEQEELFGNLEQDQAQALLDVFSAQKALEEAKAKREQMNYPRCGQDIIDSYYADYQDALKTIKDLETMGASKEWLASVQVQRDTAYANYDYCTSPRSESEIGSAEADITLAQTALVTAEEKHAALSGGPDATEIAEVLWKLEQAELDVEKAKRQLEAVELRAPMDGVILSVEIKPGSMTSEGMKLLLMADPRALEAVISVIEEDYPLLSPGQAVELFVEALPEFVITGKVDRIVPKRVSSERPVYNVYITLDEVPAGLVDGMTVDASVILEKKTDVVRLPRAAARFSSGDRVTIEVWKNNRSEQREIVIGLRGDVFVEVMSGLEPGEKVVSK